jgi:hypothetical protein
MACISLDSPSCEVPCWILLSVVYRDVTRQAKGLHRLKYVGALEKGLPYLSRCNSGWFCHNHHIAIVSLLRHGSGLFCSCTFYTNKVSHYLLKGPGKKKPRIVQHHLDMLTHFLLFSSNFDPSSVVSCANEKKVTFNS